MQTNEYTHIDESLGSYSWSPDGEQMVYDRKTYAPNGTERIFIRPRQGGEEQTLGPDYEPGYAFEPVIAPNGDLAAYFASDGGMQTEEMTLSIIPISGGDPIELGKFQQAYDLAWSPDGGSLSFVAGAYPDQQVMVVNLASAAAEAIGLGQYPAWKPPSP